MLTNCFSVEDCYTPCHLLRRVSVWYGIVHRALAVRVPRETLQTLFSNPLDFKLSYLT